MNFRVNTSKGVKVRIYSAAQDPDVPLTVNPPRGSVDRRFRARLVDSPCVRGSGVPWRVSLAISLMALCALFALLLTLRAGVAQAEPPKLIAAGNPLQTYGGVGVAVDQASGDVYAAGWLTINAEGRPSAFGRIAKFGVSGKQLPPTPFGEGPYSGTAVNPANGDLYVLSASGTIETFDPGTGEVLQGSFPVQPSANFLGSTVVQIASDSSGDVYVPAVSENEVLEYSSTGTLLNTFTGGSGKGTLKSPTGVAVAPSGDLWVADAGNGRVEELSAGDVAIGEIKSEGVGAVALDSEGDVFATVDNGADSCGSLRPPCWHLEEYDSAGVQVADVGAGFFGRSGFFQPPSMVAVSEATGRVYVSDGENSLLWIYQRPTAPAVDRQLVAEVGASEAKLGALVNPGGLNTTYRFEYDTRGYAQGEAPHGQHVPVPDGTVGEGVSSRTVWASASGLAPGTTYHYRVVVTNELGTVVGPDQTFTTQTAAQRSCPNEEFRGGFSTRLPDCRAYELVVPPFKNSSQARGVGPAAADGNALGFSTQEPLPGAPTGSSDYVFTRGANGWSWEGIIPLESYTGILCSNPDKSHSVPAFSEGLSAAIISFGGFSRQAEGNPAGQGDCNGGALQVVPGEPVGYQNLLARDNRTGTYRLVNVTPPGVTPADATFGGASADLSHVVFSELARLTPDAPAGVEDTYEWDEGALRLLTVLPNGAPVTGSLVQSLETQDGSQAISADGSHILFSSGGGLYDRIDGERTVQVDDSQGGSGAGGGGGFWAASADGSRVLFTDESRLTADSTATSGEPDLYECVLAAGASTCALNDLTVAGPGEHAGVLSVSGFAGKDDSHVYFTARGVLAGNRREYLGDEGKPVVEEAKSGEENLYLEDDGTITFIATLEEGNFGVGAVSPDGASFAFDSNKSLTGYDNAAPGHGQQHEVFVYDAATNKLVCASCNPSGEAPAAGGADLPSLRLRPLSNGGRVFFETEEALLPSDTNGHVDVYEFEDGRLSLISTGTSAFEAEGASGGMFKGASESGGDVFFEATQQLVPQDTAENTIVVYDARVGGGIPAGTPPPPCATADACRAPVSPQPSLYGAPSSQTFSGPGNLAAPLQATPKVKPKPKVKPVQCRKGFVKRRVKGRTRCVRNTARKARKSVHANKRGH
jgi:NHL repeat